VCNHIDLDHLHHRFHSDVCNKNDSLHNHDMSDANGAHTRSAVAALAAAAMIPMSFELRGQKIARAPPYDPPTETETADRGPAAEAAAAVADESACFPIYIAAAAAVAGFVQINARPKSLLAGSITCAGDRQRDVDNPRCWKQRLRWCKGFCKISRLPIGLWGPIAMHWRLVTSS
jgi:hypothetical protein